MKRWATSVLFLVLVLGCDSSPRHPTDAVLPFLNDPEAVPTDREPAVEKTPALSYGGAVAAVPLQKSPDSRISVPNTAQRGKIKLPGTYSCEIRSSELPLGPFKLPRFGCRIFKDKSGVLVVKTSRGLASLNGMIRRTTEGGFKVIGHFRFPGHQLRINVQMTELPEKRGSFEGRAAGLLNTDKREFKNYWLLMAKV